VEERGKAKARASSRPASREARVVRSFLFLSAPVLGAQAWARGGYVISRTGACRFPGIPSTFGFDNLNF
jgi:hypothetical protein